MRLQRRGPRSAPLLTVLGVGVAALLGGCGDSGDVTGPVELGPIEVKALDGPVPVPAEGAIQVVYEIEVFNPAENGTVRLAGLTVTSGSDPVATYTGGNLRQILSTPDLRVPPGNGRMIYLWLSFPPDRVPAALTNTVAFANTDETRQVVVDVVPREVPAVSSPLVGAGWLAVGTGNEGHHRRAIYAPAEHRWIPQRFAVDFIKVDANRRTHAGNPRANRSYYAYAEPALAVAAGRVVRVLDGVPENVPGSLAVDITLDNIGGNYVAVQAGDSTAIYYSHLIPGSLRVSPGDLVQPGDTLGLVGNSGHSDEPHLHIHRARVYDYALSGAKADGLPLVLEVYEILGNRPVSGMRFGEILLNEALVRFP